MSKPNATPLIRLRGVRHNNLKNFDLDLPTRQLIVVTGLSGSGKSSLAFDTLFAEGQRRYIETFSPYARQFFDRMDKPQVDSIEGIPPAIAIEQRNAVKSTRSTVGTMTEICDHMKLLWPYVAHLHCRQCSRPVTKESPQQVWEILRQENTPSEALVTFDLPLSEKLPLAESLALVAKQGYQRLLVAGQMVRLEEATPLLEQAKPTHLTIIQDRVKLAPANRARFVEASEQAYHFGKGKLTIYAVTPQGAELRQKFSNRFHCAPCDIEYREPTAALFSFNNPVGACTACKGFGRIITIDYKLAVPDPTKTLAGGAVKPWQTGVSANCQTDLAKACKKHKVPMHVPFRELSAEQQDWVMNGEPGYGSDKEHEWPQAWYGVKGYFRWLESNSYKMHVRVLLSRYRAYTPCPECKGKRFQPDSLLFRLPDGLSLADFYQLSVRDARERIETLAQKYQAKPTDPLGLVLTEVRARLSYLDEVGLNYLTLDRATRSLSGGETERVNLTTCLGSRLVNTLFVLDEPSVGLHARDTNRLIQILQRLRDAGNTVLVVEHEASVMRAADQIIDLGPGHGETGGHLVFQGPYREVLRSKESLTGKYLSGRTVIPLPTRRAVTVETPKLTLSGASTHNLQNLTVELPLGRLVAITGVSGSGKTTLMREVLLPALMERIGEAAPTANPGDRLATDESNDDELADSNGTQTVQLSGWENIGDVVLVDQSSLGKTPRSNPAVYVGAFEDIRDLFGQTELAKQRGLNSSAFSFNSGQGQCERCRGAGFEKIEMQFLSDIFIRCPECNGRRYRQHILEIKLKPPEESGGLGWSIADVLDAPVEDALAFLRKFTNSKPANRAAQSLQLLVDVGLGYLRLGQPINTLSGGESQRLKLVRHLTESTAIGKQSAEITTPQKPSLFLFDEPTTGLHFDDVRVLLAVFQRIVDAGHSVVVIEHNLDVIKCADWVIDLGPDAGADGGKLVATGTPETVMHCKASHTGSALKEVLGNGKA